MKFLMIVLIVRIATAFIAKNKKETVKDEITRKLVEDPAAFRVRY